MSDTGPLFVSSGDLIADRRYKWAIDQAARGDFVAAADILAQTVEIAPAFATAWFALGAIRALSRKKISVPGDVSVVGYDNMLLSRLSTPTLSTVQQDIPKAGRMLVSKLLEWSGDPRPEMLSTELIIRESCGA